MKITKAMTEALEAAQEAQGVYWEALLRLEELIDREIDGTRNLSDLSIQSLLAE